VLVFAVQFAIDLIAWSSASNALWASSLSDESRDDAMKLQTIVEAVLSELDKVGDRFRCVLFKEFHGHGAAVGGDFSLHINLWMQGCQYKSIDFP
jgi:hypothetical protein